VTASLAVFETAMGKINVYNKIIIESQQNETIWKSMKFYINLHLKDRLEMDKFTAR